MYRHLLPAQCLLLVQLLQVRGLLRGNLLLQGLESSACDLPARLHNSLPRRHVGPVARAPTMGLMTQIAWLHAMCSQQNPQQQRPTGRSGKGRAPAPDMLWAASGPILPSAHGNPAPAGLVPGAVRGGLAGWGTAPLRRDLAAVVSVQGLSARHVKTTATRVHFNC
jgi:hypothetical protein